MTPAFKRWFGDSKVVDAAGKPLRVYHWTPKNFTKFKAGGLNPALSGAAIWLAPDPGMMNAAHNLSTTVYKDGKPAPEYRQRVMLPELGEGRYVWEGVNVMPLYARIERPLEQVLQLESMADWPKPPSPEYEALLRRVTALHLEDKYTRKAGLPTAPYYLTPDELARCKELGFDGIIARTLITGDIAEVIVFSPEQVKSAIGNRGTYSRRSHDILKGV